jgi:ABC-type glycerol-3-phosphate transport system substrate-binding protein
LDTNGTILRNGSKAITTGGWWWGVPKDCPDPQLAYKLFISMTSRENQLKECVRFGMIPVRKDILKSKEILFTDNWISKVFQTSYRQIQQNDNNILPTIPYFDKIVNVYLEAWFDIVASGNWAPEKGPPDREFITTRIIEKHSKKISKFLRR